MEAYSICLRLKKMRYAEILFADIEHCHVSRATTRRALAHVLIHTQRRSLTLSAASIIAKIVPTSIVVVSHSRSQPKNITKKNSV